MFGCSVVALFKQDLPLPSYVDKVCVGKVRVVAVRDHLRSKISQARHVNQEHSNVRAMLARTAPQ